MINENTIIKLYEKIVWSEGKLYDTEEISTLIIDEIIYKLSKNTKQHPLKDLFLDINNRGPFYGLVHFVFCTVDKHVKQKQLKEKQ